MPDRSAHPVTLCPEARSSGAAAPRVAERPAIGVARGRGHCRIRIGNLLRTALLAVFCLLAAFGHLPHPDAGRLNAAPLEESERDALFREGNEAYVAEQFEKAVNLYEHCLQMGESSALHYNLGNAYFKTGEIGHAVLHYKRALVLDPKNAEAETNLAFVRRAAGLAIPKVPFVQRFSEMLPLGAWTWAATIAFWLLVALLIFPPLYGGRNIVTRMGTVFCIVILLCAVVALYSYHDQSRQAVILTNDTPLRVAPATDSPPSTYAQAGQVAQIDRKHQHFYFLRTDQGDSGWVYMDEMAKVWE